MTSKDAFAAVEKQARTTLSHYKRYRLGPPLQAYATITPKERFILAGSLFASLAYAFTVQAEVYVGMAIMHEMLGEQGWLAGVLAIIGSGLVCSFLMSEVIPYTRMLTHEASVAPPDRMETMVGRVLGMRHRQPNTQRWLILITCGAIVFMLSFISYFTFQENIQTELGPAKALAPMLFCLDVLCGIGPFWLVVFAINRGYRFWQNRQAQANYDRLEAAWNHVAELYSIAQEWYFREHPEVKRRPELLPPVPPLCGYIITHPCYEGIEIPDAIINPDGDSGGTPVAETGPDDTPPDPSSGNGSAPAAAAVKPSVSKDDSRTSDKDELLDNPADLFAAMDSHSDANDVTF